MDSVSISQAEKKGASTLSGILLIGGTSIGAGMLALPIMTGMAGFFPGMLINATCWLFMLATGLLFLEVTLWMEEGANVLSMTKRFLGPVGRVIGGFSYIFLYYCLMVAYLAGGTPLLTNALESFVGMAPTGLSGYLLFAGGFGLIVFLGARVVDRVNWILMISLILSYVLLMGTGSSEVQIGFLLRKDWGLTLFAAPILFSAYGYHNIIPTVTSYLKRDIKKLRLALILGTSFPFLVYTLWQWMIIGSLSPEQIALAANEGIPATHMLQGITGSAWVSLFGGYFGFFALVTSFLGVSLSMIDFFADGLKVSREGISRLFLSLLVFLPPAIFAAAYPGIFIKALSLAGGFGEAILNGIVEVNGSIPLRSKPQPNLRSGHVLFHISRTVS